MKKVTLIVLLTILFSSTLFAQKSSSLEKANRYLKEKGEVIFTFKAISKAQFYEINNIISVSHKHVDENNLEVEAYANKDQFKKFLTYGLNFEVSTSDNEIPLDSNTYKATAAWDTTWDAYPKYSEYVAKMNYWATTYPNLCTLQNIGATPNGRALYVLKISDNATSDETEPEFFYSSSMHGDEITGYPTMLHFIDELLSNYGTNTEITNLVNGTELFICPLANPDGSYKTTGNDIMNSTGNTATRGNAAGVDMNRNYPDFIGGIHPDGLAFQTETTAFLNFEQTRNFVLAANYHGGAEVVNFPWDTSNAATGSSAVSVHPQDAYFRYASRVYAEASQIADGNLNYMDDVYGTGQFVGTTNGAIWYTVKGGRQDYNNCFNHNKEVTIEVSTIKFPAAANLPFHWDRNRQALLNFVKEASYGIQGVVTDQSGFPIHAKVYVNATSDGFGAWVETSPTKGDYHKVQIAGTYNVIFEAAGYATQTISVTITNGIATTLNVVMVPSTTIPVASDATICVGQTAALSATGSGTIKWYNSATSTSVLASTAAYTTPALSTTTSYWVESEITPANVGPVTVTGTVSANAAVANRYLIFNCTTPTKLKSVLVTASAVGQIYVELRDNAGVMLESKIVRLTTTGTQDINLDFFLPVATGLRLVSREISGLSLTCATSGIVYPITSGPISITANSGAGIFFQFFNWKLAPVKSNRDEVIVTVKPNPIVTTISPTSKLSGSTAFTLTVNGSNFVSGDAIIRWNGTNRTTTFVSASQLTASITAADVLTAGTANVTVFSTCNSSSTAAQTFTISATCTAPVANVTNLPTITGQCSATVTAPTATSNCYGTIVGTTNNPTTYNSQGTSVINWTYNDGNGHTSTQQQTVTITDTTEPVPNSPSLPTLSGQCSVTVTQIPTSTDNCMGIINATTFDPLTYTVPGSYSILWYFTDNRGNQSFQQQNVLVTDNIAPIANITNLPTINGQCSVTVTAPTATDNCFGQITGTTPSPLTYSTQGTYSIVWTYGDANGNTSTQTQQVIVNDTTAPVANVTTLPTITGQCSASVTAPTALDNCSGQITGTTASPLTYSTQGTFNITWTYTDARGNTSTQTQQVIVNDTTAPVANVTTLPTITGQCSASVTAPTALDNCSGTITGTTASPLTYSTQGTFNITWTYTDARGNASTQTQQVIVNDTTAPVANVTTLPTITGQCSASVTAPTATDNCSGTITGTTASPLTYSTQGTFNITWTYTDARGNASTQTQQVIVNDTTAPVANVTTLPTITGQCSASVTAPTATDNCSGTITGTTASPLTYSTQGTFNITWTYTDARGNTSTQTQQVIVNDTTAPVATLASLATVTGQCLASVTAPTALDNCSGQITGTTASPLTYSTQGTFNITWTYTDARGNASTQTQQVIVNDTTAPVANVTTLPTIIGQCSASVTAPTALDNCSGQITGTTASPLTYSTQGTFNITWTYTDARGNTSTQTQQVIVNDTTAPVANVTTLPTITGQCLASVTAPTATDNCSGQITGATASPLTYATQGTFNITWTYTDARGNASTQTQQVIVNDTTAPVANVTTLPTITGQCSASVTAPTATDNCSGTITGITALPLSYSSQGTFNITWTYTDARGNASTQTQQVIVNDTTAPVANVTTLPTITGQCFASVTAPTALDNCSGTITGITASPLSYSSQGTFNITWTYTDARGNASTQTQQVIVSSGGEIVFYYQDLDGDGYGNPSVSTETCIQPQGYVTNNSDCDDSQIQFADIDGDGFGSTNQVACGVNNNTDCNDNNETINELLTFYQDTDGDGFGSNVVTIVSCSQPEGYVTNNEDCNDNQIQYLDSDGDGFGSTTQVDCGVANNTDCNDNNAIQNVMITFYQDLDGDSYGNPMATIQSCNKPIGYVTNNSDCNDNQIQYSDLDDDGYGSSTIVACGVENDFDCNDNNPAQNLLTTYYQDLDNDGFGNAMVSIVSCNQPIGYIINNSDCNDNQIQYIDVDGDGFGSNTIVACGVENNTDCNDNNASLLELFTFYQDADGDSFGSNTVSITSCSQPDGYVSNNEDCDDSQILYLDADGDGYGSLIQVDCGVSNYADCNDNNPNLYETFYFFRDADGDGFGDIDNYIASCSQPNGFVTNSSDCNDNQIQYADFDGDGFGSSTMVACGILDNSDCNDNQIQYADLDGDGFGSTTIVACGVTNHTDCNDNNASLNTTNTFYQDADGDGFGSALVTQIACSQPVGFVTNNTDCNDNNATQNTAISFYQDADGDGFGSALVSQIACSQPVGFVTNNSDCNDSQIQYSDLDSDGFGSTTIVACGVINNSDCNDNNPNQNEVYYYYNDADGDGFGDLDNYFTSCTQPVGFVSNFSDCNDNQIQYADLDNDGFGSTTIVACGVTNHTDCNDNNASLNTAITFYQDADGDGFGSALVSQIACSQPIGFVTNNLDCNDNQIQYADLDGDGLGSTTIVACGVTNHTDCNDNNALLNVTNTFYQDADGDGFGSALVTQMACSQPVGFVTNNTDCNDNNASLNTAITFYQDADGDGFGSALVTQMACSKPVGFVTNNTDCNDSQIQYADLDGDGLGSTTIVACGVTNNTDCNDNNALLNVTNTYYQDLDADGFGNPSITISACSAPIGYVLTGTDCDDTRANVHPGAIDVCYDGLDNDCNGVIDNVGQPGGCTPIVTTIRPETCGVTLTNIDQQILAYLVSNVQGYRWRVTKVIGGIPSTLPADIQYKETTLRALQLTQLTTYAYETTYQIEVSVKINNVWQPFYGNACYVITPTITTSIKPEYCGVPLSSFNQTVLSYLMSYTTGYRFRIKNTNTGQVQIVDRGLRDFRFNMITNPQFYVPYTIEVALRNTTGNYMAYGPVCNLMLQNTSSKEVEVKEASINAIVTPNPFSDSFNLKLENFKEDKLTISTYDLTGRLLETKTLTSSELSSVTFGENYPSGVYTLIITQNSLVKTIRVVKR